MRLETDGIRTTQASSSELSGQREIKSLRITKNELNRKLCIMC